MPDLRGTTPKMGLPPPEEEQWNQTTSQQVNAYNRGTTGPTSVTPGGVAPTSAPRLGGDANKVATPKVAASAFANPSMQGGENAMWYQNLDGTWVQGSARDFAASEATRPDRVAPQAGGSQLNLGLLGPGLAVTGGGLADSAQARAFQAGQVGRLTAAAEGQVPSVAEQQMKRGLGQGLANSLALAASARGGGGSSALAQRAAIDANANLTADVAQRTGELRAGEMATARGQLTDAITGVRGQDLQGGQLGLGLSQVGLGAASAQLSADQATSLANLDAQLRQTGMDDQRRLAYLAAELGIDARTQEGQQALQELLVKANLGAQQISAARYAADKASDAQMIGGLFGFGAGALGTLTQ